MSVDGVRGWVDRLAAASASQPRTGTADTAAGLLALLGVGLLALVRVALNLPADLPVAGAYPTALAIATGAPALGLAALALRAEQPVYRVGLLFAGVFGLLTLVAEPAVVPATIALLVVVLGVASLQLRDHVTARRFDRVLVVATLAAGGVLSLAAGIGVETATLRPVGSRVVLLAIAATPVFVDWDREALAVGVGVGLAVLAVGSGAPFVTGAISLVVGGVVGASLPLLFVGTVGATILLWAGLRTGRTELAIAAGLLLVAGIPATVPRGLAFLTALALLGGDTR